MRKNFIISLVLVCLHCFFVKPANGEITNQERFDTASEMIFYEELYNQLMELTPEPAKVAVVNNFSFQRDVARFELHEGKLYQLSAIKDRISAVLFLGSGSIKVTPPTKIEQEQLYRFYKDRSLKKNFSILFLIFADSTLAEFEKHLSFSAEKIDRDVKNHIDYCLKYLSNKKSKYFSTFILKTFFDDELNGLFYAHFSKDKFQPMFFSIDPYAVEEVRLSRRAEGASFFERRSEVVCQFHKQEDYAYSRNFLENERKDLIKILHYDIESTIKGNLDFSGLTEVEFKLLKPGQNWIYFDFFPNMVVDSAFWESGKEATYFKKKKNPILWIRCDPFLSQSQLLKLKLFYHGDLIDYNEAGWLYIKSPLHWYPRYGNREPATFNIIFHTPKKYTLLSVGEKVFSKVDKDMITTRWVTSKPIQNASFNLGYYKEYKIKDERIPPINVYMAKGGHGELAARGFLSGKNMEKQVGADIANSLSFFQDVFGDSPVNQLYATETPYLHGLAFPGLIHLSWVTFQSTDEEGYHVIFRGHEVAHQWWGIEVDFKTYHDQWLSEGFSTYAGLWYMQTVLHDNKKFFNMLKEYRKEIFNNRKYLFGSGQEAGPIWLGYRTSSSKTRGDYNLIIYKKGAWVLHMLRNMMLDLKTMNEDRYKNMLRDFYKTYRGKKTSTEAFKKIVEKHIGMKMDWFFDQWIYATALPKYRFAYKIKKRDDGKYLVRCKIEQQEVPEDFRVFLDLHIDFGNDRFARIGLFIDKPVSEIDLPLMPLKPKKIILNNLKSTLCEIKNVKWKD